MENGGVIICMDILSSMPTVKPFNNNESRLELEKILKDNKGKYVVVYNNLKVREEK